MKVTLKPIEVEQLLPPKQIPKACYPLVQKGKGKNPPPPTTTYFLKKVMSSNNAGRTAQSQYWELVQTGDFVAYPEWGAPFLIPAGEMAERYEVVEESADAAVTVEVQPTPPPVEPTPEVTMSKSGVMSVKKKP